MEILEAEDFLDIITKIPVVDVRSPGEFQEGHIRDAHNIALFDDDERAIVGTTYKKTGKYKAIETGLEIVGPKMVSMTQQATKIATQNQLAIYCWRGGMRSEKMAWLFELVGLKVYVLKGGYKTFRNKLLEDFDKVSNLIILQGATGSGKTEILKELEHMGEQVIDLEGFANHKGSAFGGLGMEEQPTTSQFQNNIYDHLRKLDPSKRIWVESESLTIGRVYLPETLWKNMNRSKVVELSLDKEMRARRLVHEYGSFGKELIVTAITKISDRFGGNRAKEAIRLLGENKLYDVAILLLDYYDKSYNFSKNKYKEKEFIKIESKTGSPLENAVKILNALKDTSKAV